MRNNRKGFTLIELLAAMVILGIIMAVAVPNVLGILGRNRDNTYVEDGKKLASLAEYKYRSDTSIPRPTNTSCIVMTLGYLDSSELDNAPNNGRYSSSRSFVVIQRKDNTNHYYVNLVEELLNKSKDASGNEVSTVEGYKGLYLIDSSSLTNVDNPSALVKEGDNLIGTDINSDSPDISEITSITGCSDVSGKVYR